MADIQLNPNQQAATHYRPSIVILEITIDAEAISEDG